MIAEWLRKVEERSDLSAQEAEAVMDELLEGRLAQEQIVALLISLRDKGEAVEELVGFARAMRRRANHGGAQAHWWTRAAREAMAAAHLTSRRLRR